MSPLLCMIRSAPRQHSPKFNSDCVFVVGERLCMQGIEGLRGPYNSGFIYLLDVEMVYSQGITAIEMCSLE